MLFTTLAELAQALESASHPSLMRQRLRRYIAPSLLVIDEVGTIHDFVMLNPITQTPAPRAAITQATEAIRKVVAQ